MQKLLVDIQGGAAGKFTTSATSATAVWLPVQYVTDKRVLELPTSYTGGFAVSALRWAAVLRWSAYGHLAGRALDVMETERRAQQAGFEQSGSLSAMTSLQAAA